jgi:hypothetical protein
MAAVPVEHIDELPSGSWVDELVRICDRDGELVREAVEKEARNPRSALHRYFEWDEAEGAYKYRLIQAGSLIRRATVLLTFEESTVRVRPFLHTQEQNYQPTHRVLNNKAMRTQVLERMRSDFEFFMRKYEKYENIAGVSGPLKELRAWYKEHLVT